LITHTQLRLPALSNLGVWLTVEYCEQLAAIHQKIRTRVGKSFCETKRK